MKYIIALIVLLSCASCAHVSPYNQGCRDGINNYVKLKEDDTKRGGINDVGRNPEVTNYFCDMLDARYNQDRQGGRVK